LVYVEKVGLSQASLRGSDVVDTESTIDVVCVWFVFNLKRWRHLDKIFILSNLIVILCI